MHYPVRISFPRPAELIVGDSGTRLMVSAEQIDRTISAVDGDAMLTGHRMIDGKEADFSVKGRFGYFLFEKTIAGWNGRLYDVNNAVLEKCSLRGRELRCFPAKR